MFTINEGREWNWNVTAFCFTLASLYVSFYPLLKLIPSSVQSASVEEKILSCSKCCPLYLVSLICLNLPFFFVKVWLWLTLRVNCIQLLAKNVIGIAYSLSMCFGFDLIKRTKSFSAGTSDEAADDLTEGGNHFCGFAIACL